jgi:class 3 adenylate cyclase
LWDLHQLLMEDVCSDLVRFLHSRGDPSQFGAVQIDREWPLGPPGAFADLRVEPLDGPPYYLEVKYGYDTATLLRHLRRKYGTLTDAAAGGAQISRCSECNHPTPKRALTAEAAAARHPTSSARSPRRPSARREDPEATRLVLVVPTAAHADWPAIESRVRASLAPSLQLELWDEQRLQSLIAECFGQRILSFAESELLTIRERIDQGKEQVAFGDEPPAGYSEGVLRHNLLWHFGTWRLAELRHAQGEGNLRQLAPPGSYEHVVVIMADLSNFSRYVRDTPDDAVVRQMLTSFYAKSRYQVINAGGMLAQFVADQVIALFGIPDLRPGYVNAAVRTAFRLLDIGASVAHNWQRRIDHVEPGGGVHISMAMGRVQLVSMRSLDYARLQTIGDCLQISSRLLPLASAGQIVISNMLRHALQNLEYEFTALPPFDAKNIGTLQPWRLLPRPAEPREDVEIPRH